MLLSAIPAMPLRSFFATHSSAIVLNVSFSLMRGRAASTFYWCDGIGAGGEEPAGFVAPFPRIGEVTSGQAPKASVRCLSK